MTAGRIARELWWTNQEFPLPISFHSGSPCSYITCEMNDMPDGSHSSETEIQSHPISIIIMNVHVLNAYCMGILDLN
jgi:hypothetical protein